MTYREYGKKAWVELGKQVEEAQGEQGFQEIQEKKLKSARRIIKQCELAVKRLVTGCCAV